MATRKSWRRAVAPHSPHQRSPTTHHHANHAHNNQQSTPGRPNPRSNAALHLSGISDDSLSVVLSAMLAKQVTLTTTDGSVYEGLFGGTDQQPPHTTNPINSTPAKHTSLNLMLRYAHIVSPPTKLLPAPSSPTSTASSSSSSATSPAQRVSPAVSMMEMRGRTARRLMVPISAVSSLRAAAPDFSSISAIPNNNNQAVNNSGGGRGTGHHNRHHHHHHVQNSHYGNSNNHGQQQNHTHINQDRRSQGFATDGDISRTASAPVKGPTSAAKVPPPGPVVAAPVLGRQLQRFDHFNSADSASNQNGVAHRLPSTSSSTTSPSPNSSSITSTNNSTTSTSTTTITNGPAAKEGDLPSPSLATTLDEQTFGSLATSTHKWDQFQVNESKFGVKTTFDETEYTTKIDRSTPDYEKREREARRLASEIESSSSDNLHLQEERNHRVQSDNRDEEDRYSGVQRPNMKQQPQPQQQQRQDARSVADAPSKVPAPAKEQPQRPRLSYAAAAAAGAKTAAAAQAAALKARTGNRPSGGSPSSGVGTPRGVTGSGNVAQQPSQKTGGPGAANASSGSQVQQPQKVGGGDGKSSQQQKQQQHVSAKGAGLPPKQSKTGPANGPQLHQQVSTTSSSSSTTGKTEQKKEKELNTHSGGSKPTTPKASGPNATTVKDKKESNEKQIEKEKKPAATVNSEKEKQGNTLEINKNISKNVGVSGGKVKDGSGRSSNNGNISNSNVASLLKIRNLTGRSSPNQSRNSPVKADTTAMLNLHDETPNLGPELIREFEEHKAKREMQSLAENREKITDDLKKFQTHFEIQSKNGSLRNRLSSSASNVTSASTAASITSSGDDAQQQKEKDKKEKIEKEKIVGKETGKENKGTGKGKIQDAKRVDDANKKGNAIKSQDKLTNVVKEDVKSNDNSKKAGDNVVVEKSIAVASSAKESVEVGSNDIKAIDNTSNGATQPSINNVSDSETSTKSASGSVSSTGTKMKLKLKSKLNPNAAEFNPDAFKMPKPTSTPSTPPVGAIQMHPAHMHPHHHPQGQMPPSAHPHHPHHQPHHPHHHPQMQYHHQQQAHHHHQQQQQQHFQQQHHQQQQQQHAHHHHQQQQQHHHQQQQQQHAHHQQQQHHPHQVPPQQFPTYIAAPGGGGVEFPSQAMATIAAQPPVPPGSTGTTGTPGAPAATPAPGATPTPSGPPGNNGAVVGGNNGSNVANGAAANAPVSQGAVTGGNGAGGYNNPAMQMQQFAPHPQFHYGQPGSYMMVPTASLPGGGGGIQYMQGPAAAYPVGQVAGRFPQSVAMPVSYGYPPVTPMVIAHSAQRMPPGPQFQFYNPGPPPFAGGNNGGGGNGNGNGGGSDRGSVSGSVSGSVGAGAPLSPSVPQGMHPQHGGGGGGMHIGQSNNGANVGNSSGGGGGGGGNNGGSGRDGGSGGGDRNNGGHGHHHGHHGHGHGGMGGRGGHNNRRGGMGRMRGRQHGHHNNHNSGHHHNNGQHNNHHHNSQHHQNNQLHQNSNNSNGQSSSNGQNNNSNGQNNNAPNASSVPNINNVSSNNTVSDNINNTAGDNKEVTATATEN